MGPKRSAVRLRQAGVLLAGAVAYLLLVEGPLNWNWTPLVVGAVYLGAAVAGGRDGGHWPTALVLLGWGLGVVAEREWGLDVPAGSAQLAGIGLGLVAAELARRRGVEADPLGGALTTVAAGVLFMVAPHVDLVVEPVTWALVLAAVGLANLALAFSPGRRAGSAPVPR